MSVENLCSTKLSWFVLELNPVKVVDGNGCLHKSRQDWMRANRPAQ